VGEEGTPSATATVSCDFNNRTLTLRQSLYLGHRGQDVVSPAPENISRNDSIKSHSVRDTDRITLFETGTCSLV
jgi:hypothetical protein